MALIRRDHSTFAPLVVRASWPYQTGGAFSIDAMTTQPTESQLAQVRAIRSEYRHDPVTGRILDPGKFEGEPIFAPYYWGIGLEGFADSDNGSAYGFRFTNNDADFALWPELKRWLGRKRSMKMFECGQGFVYCR